MRVPGAMLVDELDWQFVRTQVIVRTSLCCGRLVVNSVVRGGRIFEVLHSTSGGRIVFLLLFWGLCESLGGV